ncbi:MAG: NusA-like transcription termination signal-binding factor [Candidatus Nitrosothermus koennekii]|nr:MAG: NusA-like transcription termination signal-binding factor [Candidatus Nitrosothermus koennekii]
MTEIKLTSDELQMISLFQNVSSATARDCIIDEKMDRLIFVVEKGQMGLAIGKSGSTIKTLQSVMGKKVELVEYSEDPAEFIKNALGSQYIQDVKINETASGNKVAVVVVDPSKKGIVVGREGRNAERARMLARRYFDISNVLIVSPEQIRSEE